jgi:hypothetical protein
MTQPAEGGQPWIADRAGQACAGIRIPVTMASFPAAAVWLRSASGR